MDALLNGLMGILGGIISGLIIAIFSQRKNNAEIRRIEAETKKINTELETAHFNERKEILSKIHDIMHNFLDTAKYIGRADRGIYPLNDESEEDLLAFLEGTNLSKFDIQKLLKAEDKSDAWLEHELWYEWGQLANHKDEFYNYIEAKEIFLDNEEFIGECKQLQRLMEMVVRTMKDALKSETRHKMNELVYLIQVLYETYGPELEPFEKKIDGYIKSQLKRK
jgi:hypothetical protein